MIRTFALLACVLFAAALPAQTAVYGGAPINVDLGNTAGLGPAAATTYYAGPGTNTGTVPANVPRWTALNACTISKVAYTIFVSGTKDTTANNFTLKIYDLTTSTAFADTAFTATAQAQIATGSVTVSDAIAKGDALQIQIVSPASFGTTPTSIFFLANLLCN